MNLITNTTLCARSGCGVSLPANRPRNQRYCSKRCSTLVIKAAEALRKAEEARQSARVEAALCTPVAADGPRGATVLPQRSLGCGGRVRMRG